jgi:MFS transporter, PAT family, solute carrier family 33 (acetyl-CoA transportor), member 1
MRAKYSADMAFFAKIADPLMAGTYMTLMNVIYIGGKVFKTLTIWLVDVLTWRSCYLINDSTNSNQTETLVRGFDCSDKISQNQCIMEGGKCEIDIDGYYIEVCINTLLGIIWVFWARKVIAKLEKLPLSEWHVLSNPKFNRIENDEKKELFKI